MDAASTAAVTKNEARRRYEIHLGSDFGYVDYRMEGDVLQLMYIFVPVPYRGTGVSEKLIRFVLDEAKAENRKIEVYCSWIAAFVRGHREYQSLLA